MGYPFDKRYIDKIRESKRECEDITHAFNVLRQKYVNDTPGYTDIIDLSLKEQFALLGEAFELASSTLDGITDEWHFLWDVVEELLTSDEEKKEIEERYRVWQKQWEEREKKLANEGDQE